MVSGFFKGTMSVPTVESYAPAPSWVEPREAALAAPTAVPAAAPKQTPQGQVILGLKQWMHEGALVSGGPIPSERALSEQFSVTRGTVRRALQALQEEGLLRTQNGRTRIVHQWERPRSGALRRSIALLAPLFSDAPTDEHQPGSAEYIGRGALEGIRKQGKHTISLNAEQLTREEVLELASEGPLGVVITDIARCFGRDVELATWFREAGVLVSVYGDSPAIATFDRVTSDHESGCYELTRHLIGKGCQKILNFWSVPADLYWTKARQAGYGKAMQEAGLSAQEPVQMPRFPESHGDAAVFEAGVRTTVGYLVKHLIGPDRVDALMLTTDSDYYGVAAACRLCGLEPQRDILLVGYDNNPATKSGNSQFESTRVAATVDKRNEAMGIELVSVLMERAAGQLEDAPQRRAVKPHLIVDNVAAG